MNRSVVVAAVLAGINGLILGIPPLYSFVSVSLGGPWLPVLLGWALLVSLLVVYFER